MNINSLETLEIPLNKLLAWNGNVRTIEPEDGIGELAASITSVGLLENLVVTKRPRGKYAVVAGGRRLLALSKLVTDGALKPTFPVPCRVAPEGADLTEIGLAENVVRKSMHPLEEFQAFRKLIEEGKSVADVAARFGVTESVVNRRLALARVSPVLLAEFRDGALNLELLQAFTLTDDHTTQEAVWEHLQEWDRTPQAVRRMLSRDEISATDKRVRFVGLDNYESQGGIVRRDLFAEGEDGAYIADPAKLTQLVGAKLQSIAEELEADGWKWVTVQPEIDHAFVNRHRRVNAPLLPLAVEAQADLQALEQERDLLAERFEEEFTDEDGSEDDKDALQDQIEAIDNRIRILQANRKRDYSDAVKASCGAVIGVSYNGQPEIIHGLLTKDDEVKLIHPEESDEAAPPAQAVDDSKEETPGYSAALVESLTQHKTAAIAVELSQQPLVALATLVHALVLNEFGLDLHMYRAMSSLQISSHQANLAGASESPALALLDQKKINWARQFPTTPATLWSWCLAQPHDVLMELLAYCVARTVHGVQSKADSSTARLQHADALALALDCDMSKWFTASAQNFFLRVSKSKIADALRDASKPVSTDGLKRKKAELAALAEKEIAGTGWLPEPVRVFLSPTAAGESSD